MDTQTKRTFKDRLYEQFAHIGKALSNGHRLELLEVLAQSEHSVETLAKETGMSVANASQHLQVLRLEEVKKKKNVFCSSRPWATSPATFLE